MAASSLLLQSPPFLFAKPSLSTKTTLKPRTLHLAPSLKPVSLSLSSAKTSPPKFIIRASSASTPPNLSDSTVYLSTAKTSPQFSASSASTPPKLSDSTRTIASLVAVSVAAYVTIAKLLQTGILPRIVANLLPMVQDLEAIRSVGCNLGIAGGPMFFAALKDGARNSPKEYLNTPLTVVAAGLGKWLDIYSGVLMIRVLLSWFPNVAWDRQPMNAIRDLCDPYLNLFRSVIPPLFNTVDISPLFAFTILGALSSIFKLTIKQYI